MEKRHSFGMLIVGGLIAFGSIGVALVTAHFNTPQENKAVVAVQTADEKTIVNSQREDSDGDGLPNWKEALLGTDKNNPDTDGDGIPDGEEVSLRTNPLAEGTELTSKPSYEAPSSLPSTEALARELFVGYAENKRKLGALTSEDTDSVVTKALQDKADEFVVENTYTINDLTLAQSDVGVYQVKLTDVLGESTSVREYELTVFARALNTAGSSEALEKLKATSLVYESIRDKLLEMPVPEDVAREHVALVNAVSRLSESVRRLSLWNGDPLDALALVDQFVGAEDRIAETVDALFTFTDLLANQS